MDGLKSLSEQEYLSKVIERLKQQRYKISENITYENQNFKYVAKRTKFESERFGFCTTFFLFANFSTPNLGTLKEYSAKSYKYSLKSNWIHPSWGICYTIFTIPVALVNSIDDNTARSIRKQEPPRHWKAFENLAVVDVNKKLIYCCEETYLWGYLYYEWDRLIIKEMLSPDVI
jgi:hypothetical protein